MVDYGGSSGSADMVDYGGSSGSADMVDYDESSGSDDTEELLRGLFPEVCE